MSIRFPHLGIVFLLVFGFCSGVLLWPTSSASQGGWLVARAGQLRLVATPGAPQAGPRTDATTPPAAVPPAAPATAPTASPASTPPPGPAAAADRYLVQPGDTLAGLAGRFQTTIEALQRANQISNPNQIFAGQELTIPPPAPNATAASATTGAPAAPASSPNGTSEATTPIMDNPNNIAASADLDPNRPYGPPVLRTDWVISKDYAAHGGATSGYGAIDFAYWGNEGATGSPVVATHAGIVHLVANDPIYGNWVWVVNDSFTTRYGHSQKFLAQEGQHVVRGQVLMEMGSTGLSTGPHVDYQVWDHGVNKNPRGYLK